MKIRTRVLAASVLAGFLSMSPLAPLDAHAEAPNVPAGWTFSFPDGEAKDGETIFLKMECYSCHKVNLPGNKVPAQHGGTGPDLSSGYSKLPKEYLAESIIRAHAIVAAPGYVVSAGQAGMGKYNHFMTIQELIDLVAFLKNLPASD